MDKVYVCEICGRETYTSDCRCNGCWEVESRLSTYMSNPKGLEFVNRMLPNSVIDYVNTLLAPGATSSKELAENLLIESHKRLYESNSKRHQWFRLASWWRRLLNKWSGEPW